MDFDSIEGMYENGSMMSAGHTVDYRNLTLQKSGDVFGPEHTEYKVINEEGYMVESVTVSAFDSVADLEEFLDEIADYNPDSIKDWLNRDDGDCRGVGGR